ncbi:MAG: HEPN domain-containing protein [Candidatus Aenigmatarchaeota archaeon]
MVLEELSSKLPKRKRAIKSFYETCLSRKKFIKVESSEFSIHLEKAKHDLQRAIKEFEDECWDWTIIKAYYSIHHAANALLVKKAGFFSKDHVCLIISLKHLELIPNEFYEELRTLYSKFSDFSAFELVYSLRKISQYNIIKWKELSKKDAEIVLEFAKKFVKFVEGETV